MYIYYCDIAMFLIDFVYDPQPYVRIICPSKKQPFIRYSISSPKANALGELIGLDFSRRKSVHLYNVCLHFQS